MRPQFEVSVIIPTYNSWSTLNDCIASIYRQTLQPNEVIVVDNASSDNTLLEIKKHFPSVKLVALQNNTGVTGGRNAGIDKADEKNKYILFFDHDMVADKNMLKNLISVAVTDQYYGIITSKIYYWKNKKRIWAAGTNINLWTGQVLFRGGEDRGQYEIVEEVQVAPAVILVKKLVIDLLKGFDKRYLTTYEDTDFCFRAKAMGFKTIYAPSAIAYHKIETSKESERQRLLNRSYFVARNRILFMKRFGRSFAVFILFSPVYLLYFIVMSLSSKDLKGLINFMRGYFDGLMG